MIFVDSSALIDFFNGKNTWQVAKLDSLLGAEIVVLGDIILTEVLQGFTNDSDFQKAKSILTEFPCFSICNKDLAIKSAENFRVLRKKGVTIRKTIDVLIATFCIENDFTLLHSDKDFEPMKKYLGLKTVQE